MKTILKNKKFAWGVICILILIVPLFTASNYWTPNVLKVLTRGSPIHGANGIFFDANDNLYIASFFGREIVVMNPLNGKIINRMGLSMGVETPDDLTFGPDGSLYWTSPFTGQVSRLTPGGDLTQQFVSMGANPISFSEDGRLFVGLDFLGDGLFELDPNLTEPPRPIVVATASNPFPFGFFNGFDFGPDGRLYGPLFAASMVISIDVDSCQNTSNPWVDCDIRVVADGFSIPAAAKFDPEGTLHVVDQSGEVFRVNTATGEKTLLTTLPPGLDNLAFDSKGSLFVSNANDGSMYSILPSGQGRLLSPGGMIWPGGVAVLPRTDGGESVFVGDLWTLREFDGLTGKDLGFTTSHALLGLGLTAPMSVSADGNSLVITYWGAGAVQVWDPHQSQVIENYTFPVPINAIRFQDDLVVADLALGVVWASTPEVILGPPYILLPTGLAANETTLWVSDWATGTIWQIDFDGKTSLEPKLVASGLSNPEGLALDLDGSLLVIETGKGNLTRVDPETGETTTLADGLQFVVAGIEGAPPTMQFNGVAVGPSGAIYITSDVDNALYRIWPR